MITTVATSVTVAVTLSLAIVAPVTGSDSRQYRLGARVDLAERSIHAEEWRTHRRDRLSFEPGGRVTIPFVPRLGDSRSVGGADPRPLPAGRRSGHELLRHAGQDVIPPSDPDNAADRPASSDGRMAAAVRAEVFGYLPYWTLHGDDTRIRFEVLTTLAYFGVVARGNGTLATHTSTGRPRTEWSGWTSSRMTSLIERAHRKGARVVLCVQRFSWDDAGELATTRLLSDPVARARLATAIAGAVRDRGVDGVNLDFEPIPDGQREAFVALVRELRAALDAEALGYQLTFAATRQLWLPGYDLSGLTAEGAADAVFLMGYDYRGSRSPEAGSIAPLERFVPQPTPTPSTSPTTGPDPTMGAEPSPPPTPDPGPDDLTRSLDAYLAETSPDKVILGSPYYGRAWSTLDDSLDSWTRPPGPGYAPSTTVRYDTAMGLVETHGRRYDTLEHTAWTTYSHRACPQCPVTDRQVYFDSARSLRRKYDLALSLGLRGVGIWALGYDKRRPELWDALRSRFAVRPAGTNQDLPPVVRRGDPPRWTQRRRNVARSRGRHPLSGGTRRAAPPRRRHRAGCLAQDPHTAPTARGRP